jgi:cytosine/adenosine deaminase-related metal-dependent hydrolase
MIVRAPVVVTMNGEPVIDGAVRIAGDRIAQVKEFSELRVSPSEHEIVDLDGCALLPGLINAHCHLDYTCLRGKIPPQKSFTDWIRAINAEKAKLTATDYLQSIENGFREALRFGTTTIVNLESFPQLIARSSPTQLRIWWCAELIDLTAPEKAGQMVAAAMKYLSSNENGGGAGLAPHALYTASAELYRQCQVAPQHSLLLTTHLAESREESEMFRDGSGALFEFLQNLGRDMSDCGGATPVQVFLQHQRRSDSRSHSGAPVAPVGEAGSFLAFFSGAGCNWIVAHLNELTKSDFDLLKRLPGKFSLAHCPRSHAYFQHSPFPFDQLRGLGFNICLATDSLASNADLSLFAEMREFRRSHPRTSANEVLQMVTTNPAKALGRADQLGKIAPGHLADMIVLPLAGLTDIHGQIIAFEGEVPWKMIGGEVL